MITDHKLALKPILESSEGVHLSAYLVNRGDLSHLKSQLRETISEAYEWLYSVLTVDERKKFLEPLDALLNDARIFKGIKGNIGIFRTKSSFRVLSVPVELERQCHVATSFHVKPLLRWMQLDREFLLLGLTDESAHLYFGNQNSFQKISQLRIKREETFFWLSGWLEQITENVSPRLFLAGDHSLVKGLLGKLNYKPVVETSLAPRFDERNVGELCQKIRKTLREEARRSLENSLLEFRFAEEVNLAMKNIFQISKAVIQGRVKKLIVAYDLNVFGKVDRSTGEVAIHPFDLDHEDDDILDDLAQEVLASGGEVVIAPREEMPKGRPILAILEHQEATKERSESVTDYEAAKVNFIEGRKLI